MGCATKAIYRLARGGRITHKGQTNAKKIVEHLMDKYNKTATTLFASSRQLEAQEWGRLKTHGAPLYMAACKLKMPIKPEEQPRVTKDMQARINKLLEQAVAEAGASQQEGMTTGDDGRARAEPGRSQGRARAEPGPSQGRARAEPSEARTRGGMGNRGRQTGIRGRTFRRDGGRGKGHNDMPGLWRRNTNNNVFILPGGHVP